MQSLESEVLRSLRLRTLAYGLLFLTVYLTTHVIMIRIGLLFLSVRQALLKLKGHGEGGTHYATNVTKATNERDLGGFHLNIME